MRTRGLLAAAAVVLAAGVTGCNQTVPGTVAMTTEPGYSPSTSTSPRTSTPRTTGPRTTPPGAPRTPAPSPSDAAGVTCEEYLGLDPDAQTAVVEEILTDEASVLGPGDAEIAKTLVDAACTFLPDSRVSEILTGGGPP